MNVMRTLLPAGAALLVLLCCIFTAGCISSDTQTLSEEPTATDKTESSDKQQSISNKIMTHDRMQTVINKQTEYIVIDSDPGTDDAIAYLLKEHLLKRNGLFVGTAGNVPMNLIHTNVLLLHDYLNSNSKIAFGASVNLEGDPIFYDGFCGEDGLGDMSPLFKSHMQEKYRLTDEQLEFYLNNTMAESDSIDEIARELMHHDKITYVTLGPQTTLALLILKYPELVDRIDMVYIMGGGFNITNAPYDAEFNMAGDPLADAVVFGSGLNITLIPLDVTSTCILTEEQIQKFRESGKYPEMVSILESGLISYRETGEADGFLLHDPTALICAIFPEDFTFKDTNITIDEYGCTREAEEGYPIHLAVSVDPSALYKALSLIFRADINQT
ncbi:MAG TPA: nucleoside hydrolase [Methanocorpusculum sp.]|nr:nucleoside hydrolase [Methanocorpusculum sp.]